MFQVALAIERTWDGPSGTVYSAQVVEPEEHMHVPRGLLGRGRSNKDLFVLKVSRGRCEEEMRSTTRHTKQVIRHKLRRAPDETPTVTEV